eukprot:SAG22_NODE_2931_length_2096_cov_1.806710_4_plen_61_part_00
MHKDESIFGQDEDDSDEQLLLYTSTDGVIWIHREYMPGNHVLIANNRPEAAGAAAASCTR